MIADISIILGVFFLRVIMGLRFVFPGWLLIISGQGPTKGYLEHVQGPFAPFFKKMASSKLVDNLNKWVLFIAGLALVFGVFVRLAGFALIVLMILYWLSKWPWKEGFIDERLVYIAVCVILIVLQAGFFWGFNYYLLQIPAVADFFSQNLWLRWII